MTRGMTGADGGYGNGVSDRPQITVWSDYI